MKKAVFFDAGFTLIDVFEEQKAHLLQFFCEQFSKADFSGLDWAKGQIEAERHLQLAVKDRGYFLKKTFWFDNYRIGLVAAGMEENQAMVVAEEVTQQSRKAKKRYSLDPDCMDLLKQLKLQGYRLAVVSNWDGTLEQVMEKLGIWDFFDYVADSHIVKHEKPAQEIFKITLDQMNLHPSEVIHVGDLYYTDVIGAQSVGIEPVLLDHLNALGDLFVCQRVTRLREVADVLSREQE